MSRSASAAFYLHFIRKKVDFKQFVFIKTVTFYAARDLEAFYKIASASLDTITKIYSSFTFLKSSLNLLLW